MYNFYPYNVLLSISTNIAVLLMNAFMLQRHICQIYGKLISLCQCIRYWSGFTHPASTEAVCGVSRSLDGGVWRVKGSDGAGGNWVIVSGAKDTSGGAIQSPSTQQMPRLARDERFNTAHIHTHRCLARLR